MPTTTNMRLSNPLKSNQALPRVKLAPHVIKAMVTDIKPVQNAFVATFEICDEHGHFPLNMQDQNGGIRWYQPGCPTCRKLQEADKLLYKSNIAKRFIHCRFENFIAQTPNQQQVLATCQDFAQHFATYHQKGASLLLCGKCGTGKNHLATAISYVLLSQHYAVLRVKASQYLDTYWAQSFEEREQWINGLATVDLLIVDELGRSSQAKPAQDAFFRLIDMRYENQLPSLITTNLNRSDLQAVLGEATYDRLTEGGSIRLTLNWDSYRTQTPERGQPS